MSSTPRIAWDNQLTAATWTLSPVESGNADPIGNAAIAIAAGSSVQFFYDSTSSVWRPIRG